MNAYIHIQKHFTFGKAGCGNPTFTVQVAATGKFRWNLGGRSGSELVRICEHEVFVLSKATKWSKKNVQKLQNRARSYVRKVSKNLISRGFSVERSVGYLSEYGSTGVHRITHKTPDELRWIIFAEANINNLVAAKIPKDKTSGGDDSGYQPNHLGYCI